MLNKKAFSIVLLPIILAGCTKPSKNIVSTTLEGEYGDLMNDFLPEVGVVKLLFKHSEQETVGDDGEDYFYNYCPSIMIENGVEHIYYCTNKDWGNITDHIGYRHGQIIDNKLQYSKEELVLSPTSETWDQTHTCDPSVIKGKFNYNGEDYSYLMAYLGCIPLNCKLNETGIAVAKSPNGPWIKCNDKKLDGITSINPIVPYSDFGCTEANWGTGQACLMSVNQEGRVILFTTVACPTGGFTDVREYDFSNINDYKLIREARLFTDGVLYGTNWIGNSEFCYDKLNKKFIVSKPRGGFGKDGEYPDFIADTIDVYYVDASNYDNPFDIFFDNSRTAKWTYINSVNKELSGYPRNHNTGLITDEYQWMYKQGVIGVAFTSSQYGTVSAMTYLKTYRIFATTFEVNYK